MTSPKKDATYDPDLTELPGTTTSTPRRVAVSQNGMVASQHFRATEAGVRMLESGGNAIDAAVATAFALGVCEPNASGLGGQTMAMMFIARTGRTVAIDGSSRAPYRVIPGELGSTVRRRGYRATTVPTTPRALGYMLRRYGTKSLEEVLEPAMELATRGYEITELQHRLMKREAKHLRETSAAQFFLKDGKRVYRVGDTLKQPVLADTLKRLAKKGIDDFYTGKIAATIHRDMIAHNGLIRKDDLAQIKGPIERRPVAAWFDGKRVFTFPPPGAGRTLIEMLNIAQHFPKKQQNPSRTKGALLVARVMQQAYRDRRDRPYDPNYYAQVPNKRMLGLDYARKVARRIKTSGETTHLSVMDGNGNVVAITQSIERVFGAMAVTPELGFLYNNYMMAYEHEDISHPYYLRPGAVPWASVAPTIVMQDRKPWLVIGSPGSERITSSIFQVLLRLRSMTPFEAVDAPRMHCNISGKVSLEAPRMRSDIPEILERAGFTIDEHDAYSFYLGCVQMVLRESDGSFVGVADPRRDGAAGGPK